MSVNKKKQTARLSLLLFINSLLLTALSLAAAGQVDPWRENITGLGWKNGHLLLMVFWASSACLENGLFSWLYFERIGERRPGNLCLLIWGCLLIGCLIPWSEAAYAGDLHSLLCTAAVGLWLGFWAYYLVSWKSSFSQKKTAASVLGAAAVSVGSLGISGGVSLVSEMLFVFLNAAVLAIASVKQKSRNSR